MKRFKKSLLAITRRTLLFSFLILLTFPLFSEQKTLDEKIPLSRLTLLTDNLPPVNFDKNGEAAGFAVDIVNEIQRRLKIDYPIKVDSWSTAFKKALRQDDTVLFSTSRTARREKLFKWVGPLFESDLGVFTLKSSRIELPCLESAKKLTKLCVIKGFASETYLADLGFKNLYPVPEPSQAVKMLLDGAVDAWVMPEISVPYVIANMNMAPEMFKKIISVKEPANYLAFSLNIPDNEVNLWRKHFVDIKNDGTYSRFCQKWFQHDTVPDFEEIIPLTSRSSDEHEDLRLITEEFAPLNYKTKDGNLAGFSVELVNEIKRRAGNDDKIELLPWSEGYKAALDGPRVGLFSTAKTEDRQQLFKWVGPLLTQTYYLVGRKNSGLKIDSLVEAKNVKAIGTYKDDVGEQMLKNMGFKNLKSATNNADNLRLLKEGKIDLWISSNLTLTSVAIEAGYDPSEFEPVCDIDDLNLYIAFSKDTHECVIDAWQKILDKIKKDGAYQKLAEKWRISMVKKKTATLRKVTLSDKHRKWLELHPVIKLAADSNCPPMEFFENGEYHGISKDFVELVEKKLGIKFKIVMFDDFDKTVQKIKNGELDLIGCLSKTPERSKYLNFTKPYLDPEVKIIMRENEEKGYTLEKLVTEGKKVAIDKNYAIREYVEKHYPKMKLLLVNNAAEAIKHVSLGEADATLLDMYDVSYAINKEGIVNLKDAGYAEYDYHLAFAVRKDWPELVDILNQALDSIDKEEKDGITSRWSVKLKVEEENILLHKRIRRILVVLATVLLVLLVIFIWSQVLKGQVAVRTKELRHELEERKKAEEEIRKYRDHLEELVKERSGELLESEKKFKTLFEAASAAIFLIKDGRFLDCNAKTLEMFNCGREDIINASPEKFSPPSQGNDIASINMASEKMRLTLNGAPQTFEWKHKRLDGSLFDAQVSLNRVVLNGENCVQAIVNDISVLKRSQNELTRAKDAAEAGTKAKSEFLASMSHEIRTPLNAILGFSQLMCRDADLNPEHRDNLEVINRSGEHLLTLINQILEMSKIEAGHEVLNESAFDLFQMLNDLELMFLLRADAKQVKFILEIADGVPQYIETDESKLRQVLVNLLGNAVKFTAKGHILLRVSTVAENVENLLFEVQDSGSGIAKEEISKLFSAFSQTSSGLNSGQGSGLGLAISRKYVVLMGGEISVTSEAGGGCNFQFNIHLKKAESTDIEREEPERRVVGLHPSQPAYRILVAEDSPEGRKLMRQVLANAGFDVKTVENGAEAIKSWRAWHPHLIWMDMRMPVMTGYEAIDHIKSDTEGPPTVIIALTAHAFAEEREKVIATGCDDFLCKPFKESQIFSKMRKHLGVRYEYEDRSLTPIAVAANITCTGLVSEAMDNLPLDLLNNLKQATVRADFEQIMELLDETENYDRDLAKYLRSMANNFDYDTILRLLKHKGKN